MAPARLPVNIAIVVAALLLVPMPAHAQSGGTPPTAGAPPPSLAGEVPRVETAADKASTKAAKTLPKAKHPAARPARLTGPLDLRALVKRARDGDLRVKAAEQQLAVYEAQRRKAKWAFFPSFTTTLLVGGPVPEAKVKPGATSPFDVTAASYEGDLNFGHMGMLVRGRIDAAVPVWTFGKLEGYTKAMGDLVDLGHAQVDLARDQVGFDAAHAFYGYQAARSALAALDDGISRAKQARKRIDELLKAESDQVTTQDRLKVDLLLETLQAQRARLEQGEATVLAAAGMLAGLPDGSKVPLAEVDLVLPPAPARTLAQLKALARKSRPEIRAVDAGLRARQAELGIRRAMYYPDFLIAGFGEWSWSNAATDQTNPFIYDPYNYLTAGLGLMVRATFDIPQKSADVQKTEAEVRKLLDEKALLDRAVGLDVEKAWRDLKGARAEAERLDQAQHTADKWAISAMANFELGLGDVRDVLEPIAFAAATSASRADAVYRARVAQARLAKAVGILPWQLGGK